MLTKNSDMIEVATKSTRGGCRHWKGGISTINRSENYWSDHSKKSLDNKRDRIKSETCDKYSISPEWKKNIVFNVNNQSMSMKFETLDELEKFSQEAGWETQTDVIPYEATNKSYDERKKAAINKACLKANIPEKWKELVMVNPANGKTIIRFADVKQCEEFLTSMRGW